MSAFFCSFLYVSEFNLELRTCSKESFRFYIYFLKLSAFSIIFNYQQSFANEEFLPKAKLKGNNKFWINSWNLRSWHFTQYYCDNKHVKKMTTGKNFLLSFLNEWRCENSHFWDSHFHINWFILRHLFVMFFRLFTAHLSLSPFVPSSRLWIWGRKKENWKSRKMR